MNALHENLDSWTLFLKQSINVVNALSLGITPNIVMKWTGHSDYKAMKPYIDIVDSIKASSMTKFDGLL